MRLKALKRIQTEFVRTRNTRYSQLHFSESSVQDMFLTKLNDRARDLYLGTRKSLLSRAE